MKSATDYMENRNMNLASLVKGLAGVVAVAMMQPATGWACSACYGQSDSSMARGMNWGILSLLGVVVTVLGGISTGFVFLAKRAAAISAANGPRPAASLSPEPAQGHPGETDAPDSSQMSQSPGQRPVT
jgi:hypothetical protein